MAQSYLLMTRWLLLLWVCCYCHIGAAQSVVNWYTPEVAQQLGIAFSPKRVPNYPATSYTLNKCRVIAFRTAVFDTTATFAQGRIVDAHTHKPIVSTTIQMTFSCFSNGGGSETKVVTTDKEGFFRLGWVGCSGPEGGRSKRIILIQAPSYPIVKTRQVDFGGAAYLHIELTL